MNQISGHLMRGFDYDLWANLRWLSWTDQMPDPARARHILTHMCDCQQWWLSRVGRAEGELPDEVDLEFTLRRLNEDWKAAALAIPPDQIFKWEAEGTFEDIARHVLHHGTFHRGHLRGLAEAGGFTQFDDTDFGDYFERQYFNAL